MSRKFLILWVFSACALVWLYFHIGRDSVPFFVSPQNWKTPFSSGDTGAQPPDLPHENHDTGNGLVEVLPEAPVLVTGQNEGPSDKEHSPMPTLSTQTQTHDSVATSTPIAPEQPGLSIALIESAETHDEVTAALVYAFASQKDSALTIYSARLRYGSEKIIKEFNLPISINNTKNFKKAVRESPPPPILISTTCELDLPRLSDTLDILLAGGKTYLFCVVHHADRWTKSDSANVVRPWIEKEMVDFITLSAHTAQFLQTEIAKWDYNVTVPVQVLPPVFPINLPKPLDDSDHENKFSLAMQGDYDASRRDYKGIFRDLSEVVESARNGSEGEKNTPLEVALHLIGHGNRPPVPENVKEQTVFDENLSYIDFYTILSQSFALLPAFASNEYFDRKASSTVPASIIGGVPLVASEELLRAYSYLPRDAAWISQPNEGEMDVIKRVRNMKDERAKKRGIIQVACQNIVKENIEHASEWINNSLKRINYVS